MYLSDLVNDFDIEDQKFECKLKLNSNEDKDGSMLTWMKYVDGMANYKGGTIFIGVEPKDYKLVGFTKSEADEQRNLFNKAIEEHFSPSISYTISFLKYVIREQERYILEINIPESKIRPIAVKYKGVPGFYKHINGGTTPATWEEIKKWTLSSVDEEYDTLISDKKYNKDDFKKLQRFYKEHTGKEDLSDKALKSMGFYNEDGYLSNGALLFSDDYKGSKTAISCTLFSGLTRGDQILPSINDFNGNIIDSINYMFEFITMRMNHMVIKEANGRTDIRAYPERALYEGIINAVAHRDYFLNGGQIQVDIFKDRLEISSPGSFYNQNEIDKTYDLKNIISNRRNILICNVLVACEVMEAKGTGFEKITEDYKEYDQNHQPYVISTSNHFTLVLPDLTYKDGIAKSDKPQINYPNIENGSIYDSKILSFCFRKKHSAKEISEYLNISDSSYFRKQILDNLVNNNYLIKSKDGRTIYYKTNQKYVSLD